MAPVIGGAQRAVGATRRCLTTSPVARHPWAHQTFTQRERSSLPLLAKAAPTRPHPHSRPAPVATTLLVRRLVALLRAHRVRALCQPGGFAVRPRSPALVGQRVPHSVRTARPWLLLDRSGSRIAGQQGVRFSAWLFSWGLLGGGGRE